MAEPVSFEDSTHAGQAAYTRAFLAVYDVLVLRLVSRLSWGCPRARLLRHYDEHVSSPHLDVGPGTGDLLQHCRFPVASPDITLMDLNWNSLATAARRLRRYEPKTHAANVLEPFGLPEGSFRSVGMGYLIHCLPGSMETKAAAFEHSKQVLAPGGVLFGATVLGESAGHNRLGRGLLKLLNERGAMNNLKDSGDDLRTGLRNHFQHVDVTVVGRVGLFAAHN